MQHMQQTAAEAISGSRDLSETTMSLSERYSDSNCKRFLYKTDWKTLSVVQIHIYKNRQEVYEIVKRQKMYQLGWAAILSM